MTPHPFSKLPRSASHFASCKSSGRLASTQQTRLLPQAGDVRTLAQLALKMVEGANNTIGALGRKVRPAHPIIPPWQHFQLLL